MHEFFILFKEQLHKQMTIQQFLKIDKKKWQKDFNMHVHSNDGGAIKMQKNIITIVLMSYTLSKLYVDIKFDIFNMKFKNHLFYLIVVFIRIVLIRY